MTPLTIVIRITKNTDDRYTATAVVAIDPEDGTPPFSPAIAKRESPIIGEAAQLAIGDLMGKIRRQQ